jgi:Ni,Fe-hydrogenase I cytochrome b subunit
MHDADSGAGWASFYKPRPARARRAHFAHFSSGYLLAADLLGRIYWVVAGNAYARQIFTLPLWNPK